MKLVYELFLQALRDSLEKKTVDWEAELTPETWWELFTLADTHRVLPMVYEAVLGCGSAEKADRRMFDVMKMRVKRSVVNQTVKTHALLQLLPALISAGVTPLVVKGIVCRELYPTPDYRISGDEDVFIPENQLLICHEAMLASGMQLQNPAEDLQAYEIPYWQKDSHLRIELHKFLFPPESEVFGEFNRFFACVHERNIIQIVDGVPVPTMNHTDHMLYLICHSFKHFLHSGFGIRQVCDISLYANAFGSSIDWLRIQTQCKEIHADIFAASLFRIGEQYLSFDPVRACYPEQWRALSADTTAMLEDLLDAGVYGGSSMSRKRSSTMTLQAFSSQHHGGKGKDSIMRTFFPSSSDLRGRYPYLKKNPFLLPIAWADRILKYGRETLSAGSVQNTAEPLRIGNNRIELLKQYGILDR